MQRAIFGFLVVLMLTAIALAQAPAAQPAQTGAAPQATNFYLIPYGTSIGVEDARKAAAAAVAEAKKNGWFMAVAVVDTDGDLVYFERMDNVQHGSVKVAQGKARSAALFKRPTKVFEQAVAGGGAGVRILGLEGAVPLEGGIPIVVDGRITGAIGASGDLSSNDGKCAEAGVAAISKR